MIKRTVFGVIILTILSKILGFGRELSILYAYGSSRITDSYKLALTFPTLIITGAIIGINTSLIPVLNDSDSKGKKDEFYSKFLTIIVLITLFISALVIVFAKPISYVVSLNIDSVQRLEIIKYIKYFSSIIIFQVLTYSFMGYLQKNGRFYMAASIALPVNIVTIIFVSFIIKPTLFNLVMVTIFAYLLQMLWVLIPIIKDGYRYKFSLDIKDPHIKMFFVMIIPILLSLSADQLNVVVDRNLASGVFDGSVTLMDLSSRVKLLFYSVVVVSFSTVLYTKQSSVAHSGDTKELYSLTKKNLSLILIFIVPISFALIFLNQEVVRVLYLWGKFEKSEAVITGILLAIYSFDNISNTIKNIYSNLFFSLKQSKTPMKATYIIVGINIVLSVILSQFLSIYGLALATTIAGIFGVIYMLYKSEKLYKKQQMTVIDSSFLMYIISSLVMIFVLFLLKQFIYIRNDFLYLIFSLFIGATTYGLMLWFLKVEELYDIIDNIKHFIKEKMRR